MILPLRVFWQEIGWVGDAIESHLLVVAILEIKGHSKYGYEVDNAEIWLDVTVSYQLNNGLHHFSVGNITEYDATNKEMKQTPDFTLEFVPYYRKNAKETVWDKAKDEQGVVKNPITKKVMDIEEPWDMGHKPGHEFRKHQQSAADRKITRKQFLDEYNNPNSYRPELPKSNRSHICEDKTDFYFGSWFWRKELTMEYDKKEIARKLLDDVGGTPRVYAFKDESGKEIDIFCGDDSPIEHVSSYSTVGLSDYTLNKKIDDKSLRAEIIGSTDSMNDLFPNIISDCAFKVMDGSSPCMPGTVFLNAIDNYYLDSNMKHMLLTIPFLWELHDLEFDYEYVTWLFAVPISESEYHFFVENGYQKLEMLFEKKQIDIYDLNRSPVV